MSATLARRQSRPLAGRSGKHAHRPRPGPPGQPAAVPSPPSEKTQSVGDKVTTGPGQRRRLLLPDRSVVYLQERSTLIVKAADHDHCRPLAKRSSRPHRANRPRPCASKRPNARSAPATAASACASARRERPCWWPPARRASRGSPTLSAPARRLPPKANEASPGAADLASGGVDARPAQRSAAGACQRARRRKPDRPRSRRPGSTPGTAALPHRRSHRGRLCANHHRPDVFQPHARIGWRGRSVSRCRRTPRCRGWRCTWTAS